MEWDNIYNYFFVEMSALHCPKIFIVLAVIAIILVSEAVKYPIKHFATSKIKNDIIRKKVNSAFIILPVVLGVLVSYIYHRVFGFGFSHSAGGTFGLMAAIFYEVFTRLFARVKSGESITGSVIAEDVANSTEAVTGDVLETLSTATSAIKAATQVIKSVGNATATIVEKLPAEKKNDADVEKSPDPTPTTAPETSGGKLEELIKTLTNK